MGVEQLYIDFQPDKICFWLISLHWCGCSLGSPQVGSSKSIVMYISSAGRQKGLTGYCFKYIDRSFYLQTDDMTCTLFVRDDVKVGLLTDIFHR